MDLEKVRSRWVNYNTDLIKKFAAETGAEKDVIERLIFFGIDFLIDFESELDEDPENKDGGILTLDTVPSTYMDSFLGRWLIQNRQGITEKVLRDFMETLSAFYAFLKANKLYKERASEYNRLMAKLETKNKYLKRLKEYLKIQESKDNEELYLDLMQEWEYEDL